jgi:hypothetical protein
VGFVWDGRQDKKNRESTTDLGSNKGTGQFDVKAAIVGHQQATHLKRKGNIARIYKGT